MPRPRLAGRIENEQKRSSSTPAFFTTKKRDCDLSAKATQPRARVWSYDANVQHGKPYSPVPLRFLTTVGGDDEVSRGYVARVLP